MKRRESIFLIAPSYARASYGFRYIASSILPSLGLGYVAGDARSRGHRVQIHHCETGEENLLKDIEEFSPSIIGITVAEGTVKATCDIIDEIRSSGIDAPIVLGGPLCTTSSEMIARNCNVDYLVLGEGDRGFCDALEDGYFDLRQSSPLIYDCGLTDDLSELPIPAHDLLQYNQHRPSFHRRLTAPYACIQTSRGCPFDCAYCESSLISGRKTRNRPVNQIAEELEWLRETSGVSSVIIWDDSFTLDHHRVSTLCDLFGRLSLSWNCNTRPELVDEALLKLMKRSGCKTVFLGVEATRQDDLKKLGRQASIDSYAPAFESARRAGVLSVAAGMVGLEGDTLSTVTCRAREIASLEPDFVLFSTLRVPHTRLDKISSCGVMDDSMERAAYVEFFKNNGYWYRWRKLSENGYYELFNDLQQFAQAVTQGV